MSAYSDCYALCVSLTKRTMLQSLTDSLIRAAIRKGHRAGSFPRDVKIVQATGLATDAVIQTVELSTTCPRIRQLKAVKPTDYRDIWYRDEDVGSLLDPYGFAKTDVYWQVGSTLNVRAAAPVSSIDIYYLDLPDLTNLEMCDDWVLTMHTDLVAHWAAASILNTVGEQEARTRVEEAAKEFYEDLMEESVEIIGR